MVAPLKILTVVGNRPQFIKAAAVSPRLRATAAEQLVHTGQHFDDELSAVFFTELGLAAPDVQLAISGGSNSSQTARMLSVLEPIVADVAPDCVLVYGDTNSTLAGALAAVQQGVPVAHVEAGMRSYDRQMPEEVNRVLTDHLSSLLLCSSEIGAANLAAEGIVAGIGGGPLATADATVTVVGDVMVDVALEAQPRARERVDLVAAHGVEPGAYLLATAHRAGNVDDPARLAELVELLLGVGEPVVLPLHPRTRARLEAAGLLERLSASASVRVTPPLGYLELTALLCNARAVLTDSGGLQKEAYLAGVRCVTLRPSTEWVETVEAGWNTLVDLSLADARAALAVPAPIERPQLYGDGHAGERVVAALAGAFAATRLARRMAAEQPIQIGVVGLGYWGPNLARNFAAIAGSELRWVCDDSEPARAKAAAQFPGARVTAELDDLLADPELDAIVLATPVPSHAELAVRVLQAGKHCFVEKPLAQSVADAERAVAAAAQAGKLLMVGHLLEYHPGVLKLKELAESGELGDIYYIYGNRLNLGKLRADENALWSLGAHDVSVVLALAGEEPVEAVAHGESYVRPGVEDVVFCYLRFPSGLSAHLHLSWLDPHKERRFTIVGAHKMATFDDMAVEGKITVYDKGFDEAPRGYGEWVTRSGDTYSPRLQTVEPLRLECQEFLDSIEEGRPPRSDGESGLRVVRVLEQLQDSLKASERLAVDRTWRWLRSRPPRMSTPARRSARTSRSAPAR